MDQDNALAGDDDVRLEPAEATAWEDRQPDTDGAPDGDVEAGAEVEAETFEIEMDGTTHVLPAALKGAFLRQADYTRKTQELAEARRALEAGSGPVRGGDDEHLLALDEQLSAFAATDWRALEARDAGQARALWDTYQNTRALRDRYGAAVGAEGAAAAGEMAAVGAQLKAEIEGWSPEVAARLVDYAQGFDVSLEELAAAADPRVWKILHRAWRADQGRAAQAAQGVRPAVRVGGSAGGDGPSDQQATRDWMARRNKQVVREG